MPFEIPQLDTSSFEELVAEAKARIPVHTPEWTNTADSDPGITLVQLFAFMTESLLYQANRIPEVNRIKFLSLLGVPLQPATPAQGLVTFSANAVEPIFCDTGLTVKAGKVPFLTRTDTTILPLESVLYYKKPQTELDTKSVGEYMRLYQTFLNSKDEELTFYETARLLPPEAGKPLPGLDLRTTLDNSLWMALLVPEKLATQTTVDIVRARIGGQTLALGIYPSPEATQKVAWPMSLPRLSVSDPALVFEIAAPGKVLPGRLAPPTYARLQIEDAENVLQTPGIVHLTLPPYEELGLWQFDPEEEGSGDYPPRLDDAKLEERLVTWIKIRLPGPQDTVHHLSQIAQISWAGVNTARTIQATTVTQDPFVVGTGSANQSYTLNYSPVVLDQPDGVNVTTSNFVLEVATDKGKWESWRRTDDLLAEGPQAKVYTVDPEASLISFGDGLHGYRLPRGAATRVKYEYGGGLAGAVPIGAINKISGVVTQQQNITVSVANPVATWGASEGEDIEAGERNIPLYLQHRERLVTSGDFYALTMRTPGVDIGRTEILPLFRPDSPPEQEWPGVVTVMVIPRYSALQPDTPSPDGLFLDTVRSWLDPRRLVTTEVRVCGPQYVRIWVSVGVVKLPGQAGEGVLKRVQDAVKAFLSPFTGGPEMSPGNGTPGKGWPLNTTLRQRDLEALVTRVPGVRYVDSLQLAMGMPDGTIRYGMSEVRLAGVQLPRLINVFVSEGSAEELPLLLGKASPATAPGTANVRSVAMPVVKANC